MFRIQMAEYQEKGEVERPLVSEEQAKKRTLSEISVEGIEIKDDDGNEALNVRRSVRINIDRPLY